MSEETRRALDEAIVQHIRSESEGGDSRLVTGWVLYAASMSSADMANGTCGYMYEVPENQPPHVSIGLVEMFGRELAEVQWADEDGDGNG